MHLIEVLMAGSVFVIASGSSMQLWSATAVRAHQLSSREQLEQQIEQDRIQLHTLWRNALLNAPQTPSTSTTGCAATTAQLFTIASTQAPVPTLRRSLQLSPDGQALQVHWTASADPSIQRDRVVTPAGLGLCGLAPENTLASVTALTDSQVEGLVP